MVKIKLMNDFELKLPKPKIEAKFISTLNKADIEELCDATEDAILVDGGFGWINPPQRKKLVDYWKGVLLVPERLLIVGKIDNVICGSIQLIKPARSNEAQSHLCNLTTFFIASWARGYGLARMLIEEAEKEAKKNNFTVITLEVRETQKRAIQIYNQAGFKKSGENPKSVLIKNKYYSGYYFYKELIKND